MIEGGRHRVTHTFLPPTVIYLLLAHPAVRSTDTGSLQCFWYGAAPMSVARLKEAIEVFGLVMGQLFGHLTGRLERIPSQPPSDRRCTGWAACCAGRAVGSS